MDGGTILCRTQNSLRRRYRKGYCEDLLILKLHIFGIFLKVVYVLFSFMRFLTRNITLYFAAIAAFIAARALILP